MLPDVAPVTPAAPVKPNGAPKVAQKPVDPATPKPEGAQAVAPEAVETYVIDGKQVKLTKTQAVTLIQKAGAVDKRLQEAAEQRKQVENLLKAFEADPEAVLRHLGKDPSKVFEAHLAKKAKLELMSPEEREREQLRQELDAHKQKVADFEKEKLTAAQRQMDAHNQAALEEQLIGAASKANLDRNPGTLEEMCNVALEAIELGMSMTPDQIAAEVIRRQQEHVEQRDKKILSRLTDDKALLDYLGPELVKRVLKASLAATPSEAAKAKAAKAASPRKIDDTPVPRPGKGYLKENDFNKKFGL